MFQLLHENRGQKLRLLILKIDGSCKQLKPWRVEERDNVVKNLEGFE